MKLDCFVCGKKDLEMTPLAAELSFHAFCPNCDLTWRVSGHELYSPKKAIHWDNTTKTAKHGKQITVKNVPKPPEEITVIPLDKQL